MKTMKKNTVYVVMIVAVLGAALGIWTGVAPQAGAAAADASKPPSFIVDPFWPKAFPDASWVTAEVGGVCLGADDHIFVVNRLNLTSAEVQRKFGKPAPPITEFDRQGRYIQGWGDLKVMPTRLHGCAVDKEGNVWITGNGDGMVQKYTHDGKLLVTVGKKGEADTADRKPDGPALNASHTSLNKPAGLAIDPANNDVYIADGYGNKRVVVLDKDGHYLRQWGKQGTLEEAQAGVGGVFVDAVHCVTLGNDGLVYVCDRKGDRVQVFDKQGNFKKNIYINKGTGTNPESSGSAWDIKFSPDKEQKWMYVADGGGCQCVMIFDHATGNAVSRFGSVGRMAGQFEFAHSLTVDSRGNIIVGEAIDGRRAQKFLLVGNPGSDILVKLKEGFEP